MDRIDTESLATHLKVALVCSPASTIDALTDPDRHRRTLATRSLALFIAERLGCFEFVAGPHLAGAHPSLVA